MPSRPPPEYWLRGPVEGVPEALQPVAHALLQAMDDVRLRVAELEPEEVWRRPGGAASVGFHLRHMAGSLDRLLTYARGAPLSEGQRAELYREREEGPGPGASELIGRLESVIDQALGHLRGTPDAGLDLKRSVGTAGLPSSVRGLLHHAAEHTARHAGQVSTTVRVLVGVREPGSKGG